MDRILIVRLGSMGDIIHAVPVAAALRQARPDARIDWVVDARHRDLLDLVTVVDRRIVLRFAGQGSGLGLAAGVRALRRERYDAALDLQGLLKSAVLARASGAERVIGFPWAQLREKTARLFYTEVAQPGPVAHVIRKNLALLAPLGIAAATPSFPLASAPSEAPAIVRRMLRLDERAPFALLNPGAAWPNKQWPPERFGAAALYLKSRYGLPAAVLWGPGEEHIARTVADQSAGAAAVAPPTSLADLVALARAAAVFISGDTGPLHLAAAVGTPAIGLYGPTSPARNGPWHPADVTISRYQRCQCHHKRRCRIAEWCLLDISANDLHAAVDRRLATVTSRV